MVFLPIGLRQVGMLKQGMADTGMGTAHFYPGSLQVIIYGLDKLGMDFDSESWQLAQQTTSLI